jgi:crotonobetainyl-CoA:carnitine CoA-transferase CaiB-like acyl-CoA transferase
MGARVIKVERPGGDPARKRGMALPFLYDNTNKLGITLNLEHPEGRRILLRLVEGNDVLVETFPAGYLKELELGFDDLNGSNPRLILASVTGFGQEGPRRAYKSSDLVASAFGGQMYVTGSPSSPPLKAFGGQSYFTASLFAAIGILLALRKRISTGKGEHLDISLQEAVGSTLEHVMVRYFYEQNIPTRQGSLHWNHHFCILPCKNGFIQMSIFQEWDTLVEWMANEGMAEDLQDKRWKSEQYRLRHLEHVLEVMGRWTKAHRTDELFELGQLMGYPWAPVHSPEEVLDSAHLKDRGFFMDIAHPEMAATLKYPRRPYGFSSLPDLPPKRAPHIGEHNRIVYQKELGLTPNELKWLSSINVI